MLLSAGMVEGEDFDVGEAGRGSSPGGESTAMLESVFGEKVYGDIVFR